jgi:hypothetical protein
MKKWFILTVRLQFSPDRPDSTREQVLAMKRCLAIIVVVLSSLCSVSGFADGPFVFRDVGEEAGLFTAVANISGHGVAWGGAGGDCLAHM